MERFEDQIQEIAKFAINRGFTTEDIISDKIVEITKMWYLSNKDTYDRLQELTQTEQKQLLKIN